MQVMPAMQPAELGRKAVDPRQQAEQTAAQFEAILVRQLVGSLRQTSTLGEGGGLFGGGLGADTYTDWFDQHVADHLGSSGRLGIKEVILDDLERVGQLPERDDAPTPAQQARSAAFLSSRASLALATSKQGAIDVTQ